MLAFSIHITAQAAGSFSTLEERMSGKEFKETGLVKLTDEELAVLNEWLRRHSVATLDNATARQAVYPIDGGAIPLTTNDDRGMGVYKGPSGSDAEDKVISGTIYGTFNGWAGKGTQFKLTNGMVWEQTEKDTYSANPVDNAEVIITKNFLGNWHLAVVGSDRDVRVRRIR